MEACIVARWSLLKPVQLPSLSPSVPPFSLPPLPFPPLPSPLPPPWILQHTDQSAPSHEDAFSHIPRPPLLLSGVSVKQAGLSGPCWSNDKLRVSDSVLEAVLGQCALHSPSSPVWAGGLSSGLWMEELRPKKAEQFAQGHTAKGVAEPASIQTLVGFIPELSCTTHSTGFGHCLVVLKTVSLNSPRCLNRSVRLCFRNKLSISSLVTMRPLLCRGSH